jgi:hypothetical protein
MRFLHGSHVDEASAAHRAIDRQSRVGHYIGFPPGVFAECVPIRMAQFAEQIDELFARRHPGE